MTQSAAKSDKSPLTHESVIAAAVRLADEHGLEALSMRRLARTLGVQAMSLYHHVAGREALLDGMVDAVFAEIDLPEAGAPWKAAMRERARSARGALLRHPWAVALMDSRSEPGPATLRHHDAVLGCLRRGGFSVAGAAHAFSLLDAYIYGFVLQEVALPFQTAEETEEMADAMLELMGSTYPHLTEMLVGHVMRSDYAYAKEFELGLELILEGLDRSVLGREGQGHGSPGRSGASEGKR